MQVRSASRIQFLVVQKRCSANAFSETNQLNMFAGKFNEFRFVKWVMFLSENCSIKWVILFAGLCWLWDFLLEYLKLKDKLQIWGFESFFGGETVLEHLSHCKFKIYCRRPITLLRNTYTPPPSPTPTVKIFQRP